ncbi:hypothetical protein FGD71_031695 [Streptomyces sporangiiformans]|uniref:Reductase C-terminal domain-containing protein n=2 Tax=Streptomyces sporangiiformans TaxID=2315329 RepID=A0A505DJ32_9ACTN|nr:hypothetical protein FGD71_031695 [Streptomyces sporangiiformans]
MRIQAYGYLRGDEQVAVVESDVTERRFVAAYRTGETVTGVLAVGVPPRTIRPWRQAIATHTPGTTHWRPTRSRPTHTGHGPKEDPHLLLQLPDRSDVTPARRGRSQPSTRHTEAHPCPERTRRSPRHRIPCHRGWAPWWRPSPSPESLAR